MVGWGREARRCVDRLEAFAADHPDEPALRLQLAMGVYNLLNDLGDAGRFDEANGYLARLTELAAAHPVCPRCG